MLRDDQQPPNDDDTVMKRYKQSYSQEDDSKHKKHKLILDNILVKKRDSFFDYIAGGCEIKLSVAIDLTASNEDRAIYEESLH